ncbi:MAG: site-2 protease family protein [Dehalococcoidia bacterium]
MRGTIQIGRLLGIPIGVHFSWFVPLVLVLGLLATRFYPEVLPTDSVWVHWSLAALTGFMFFTCIVLHELGHSVVARYFGIPVQSITLFVLGGVAQITRDAKKPGPELLMALAGPAVSILLGGVFMGLWWFMGQGTTAASTMWEWLWIMNLALGIFNMLPAFPMDGGRVLRATLWGVTSNFRRATRMAVWVGRALAWGLIGLGFLWTFESRLLPFQAGPMAGVQFLLIGWFLLMYAGSSLRQTELLAELDRVPVRAVMVRDVPAVYGDMTARRLLNGAMAGYGPGRDWAFVSSEERFAGVVPRAQVERVPESEQDSRVAADLMIPVAAMRPIGPDESLAEVMQRFQEQSVRVIPVVDDGEVVGLVHEGQMHQMLRQRAG